jgi:molecular chaperone HtpG
MRDKDRDAYEGFFKNFGRNLKFGIYSTYGQAASTLSDLLLFYSAKQEKLVTLDEYVDAMLADQEAIYYAAGNSVERLAKLPVVRSVLDRGFDVLLCAEDVDELCLQSMFQYRRKSSRTCPAATWVWRPRTRRPPRKLPPRTTRPCSQP